MFLVVGLGNPGNKYENNRHNIGFKIIDSLMEDFKAIHISNKDFLGELYKSHNLLFLKPTTFMNLSGKSVLAVKNFYKVQDILVLHDELDLPFGSIKFKYGGSSGGHNGLKSIDALCGNLYYRLRYGIGKPLEKEKVISWVLEDFTKEEIKLQKDLILHCIKAIKEIIKLQNPQELASKISAHFTLNAKKEG
ncbi:aminoacyl-tRNA hydrolase [Helicobacter valdiviensis]|uniref:Peptidyl-tRNA hydrolase n=1 Tax=Helicobacter valdiviensis TaxID=1458358 RepID=A0A2W6PQT7_9HELI|nr:aminoacyl-tRNA hydrolase [Helicobacter valdiviensis]PZT49113.1 aminoacyl-tRNA hydrolase [Helicobacter valdiviensis]